MITHVQRKKAWIGIQNNIVHSIREELKLVFYLIHRWLQVYQHLFIKEAHCACAVLEMDSPCATQAGVH